MAVSLVKALLLLCFLALLLTYKRALSGMAIFHPVVFLYAHANATQHLQAHKDCHPIWQLELFTLADGLGCSTQGPPVGEPSHGLAIVGRLYEWPSDTIQVQGGRHQICQQAGLRIFRSGAKPAQICPQGLCQSFHTRSRKAQDRLDQIRVSCPDSSHPHVHTSSKCFSLSSSCCPLHRSDGVYFRVYV